MTGTYECLHHFIWFCFPGIPCSFKCLPRFVLSSPPNQGLSRRCLQYLCSSSPLHSPSYPSFRHAQPFPARSLTRFSIPYSLLWHWSTSTWPISSALFLHGLHSCSTLSSSQPTFSSSIALASQHHRLFSLPHSNLSLFLLALVSNQ